MRSTWTSLVVFFLLSLGLLSQLITSSANAGSAVVGGMRLSCPNTRIEMDPRAEGAMAYPGVIVLNPREMRSMAPVNQRIIFLHECGHQFIGDSEIKADCWAVRKAKRQGWLNRKNFETVCRMMRGLPGGPYHPPGPTRCRAMRRCFAAAPGPAAPPPLPVRAPSSPAIVIASAPAPKIVLSLTAREARALRDLITNSRASFRPSVLERLQAAAGISGR